jgi:N-acetyl-gamma-glutamyl-phosphate reductase
VIDLSADYRLTDPATYEKYYGRPHPAPQPDYKVAYGLPEITKHELIERAAVVANPGCYPTASLLALMPVISAGWLTGTPIIDAKSGVSGAGRSKADTAYLFSELNGGFKAYAGVGHRHSPEIAQLAGRPVRFTPHLIPAARGIHSTLHLPILPTVTDAHVEELFYEFYRFSPCVQWVQDWPSTKQVLGSNRCDIFGKVDQESGFLVLASVIDNLVKGASGQAIQNMNIISGFDEAAGLPLDGVWP